MITGTPHTMHNIWYKVIYILDICLYTPPYINIYLCTGGCICTQEGVPGTGSGFRPSRLSDARRIQQNALDIISSAFLGENAIKKRNLSLFLSPFTFKHAWVNSIKRGLSNE